MILTKTFLSKCLQTRTTHLLVYGSNLSFINDYFQLQTYKPIHNYKIDYSVSISHYFIDVSKCKKKSNLIDLLRELCISPNYYSKDEFKKVILLVNMDRINTIYQQSVKTIVDKSYLSCMFIIHTNNLNSIDSNIRSRFIILSLPPYVNQDVTIQITYKNIIKILKKQMNKKVIESIREISYYYYMNHKNSVELQELLIKNICSNYTLPNSIKYDIVNDFAHLNMLYQHSYRKPLFLECMILCLFKHLQHHTTNLV